MFDIYLPSFSEELAGIARVKLAYVARTPKMRATVAAEKHFENPDPNWKTFERNLKGKTFQKVVENDPRADDKLKRYVENYGGFLTSKQVSSKVTSPDSGKEYVIKELPGGRLGCSCGNWQYRRSVDGGDCKHIRALTEGKVKTSSKRKKRTAGQTVGMSMRHFATDPAGLPLFAGAGAGAAAGGYLVHRRNPKSTQAQLMLKGGIPGILAGGIGASLLAKKLRDRKRQKTKTSSLGSMIKTALLQDLANHAMITGTNVGFGARRANKQLTLGRAGKLIAQDAKLGPREE